MRTKHLLGILGLFLCVFSFYSCDNDDNTSHFNIGKSSYEIMVNKSIDIDVLSGSGDIDISVANPQIIRAKYSGQLYAGEMRGRITLTGIAEGETEVYITDKVENETIILKTKIISNN